MKSTAAILTIALLGLSSPLLAQEPWEKRTGMTNEELHAIAKTIAVQRGEDERMVYDRLLQRILKQLDKTPPASGYSAEFMGYTNEGYYP